MHLFYFTQMPTKVSIWLPRMKELLSYLASQAPMASVSSLKIKRFAGLMGDTISRQRSSWEKDGK
jgi:hypothetical protein